MDALVWASMVFAFVAVEAWALWAPEDWLRPLTYHVRRWLGLHKGWRSPGWWVTGGFIAWVAFHFLVER